MLPAAFLFGGPESGTKNILHGRELGDCFDFAC